MQETSNGRKGWDALLVLATNPIGHIIAGAVVFAITFAYTTGGMRTEMKAMSDQIAALNTKVTALEAKVDTLLLRSAGRSSTAAP